MNRKRTTEILFVYKFSLDCKIEQSLQQPTFTKESDSVCTENRNPQRHLKTIHKNKFCSRYLSFHSLDIRTGLKETKKSNNITS